MKKKSKKIIMLLGVLLLLITVGAGSYTYAKYRTAVTGGGQADIAKWAFVAGADTQDIKNISLTSTVNKDTLVNGKIAPGTSGQFFINIDGTGSEVGIDYDVKFSNEKNKPTNIIFSYGGNTYKSLSEITDIKGQIGIEDESVKTRKIQIMWRWEYETGTGDEITANDVIDTQEGIADLDYSFDVTVTGTQSM